MMDTDTDAIEGSDTDGITRLRHRHCNDFAHATVAGIGLTLCQE